MNRKIAIIGIVIIVLGTVVVFLGNRDTIFSLKKGTLPLSNSTSGFGTSEVTVMSSNDREILSSMHNSVKPTFILNPQGSERTFTINSYLDTSLDGRNYPGCQELKCPISTFNITISEETQFSVSITETHIPIIGVIPLVATGIQLDPNIQHEYKVEIVPETSSGYTYSFQVDYYDRLPVIIAFLVLIIGVIITVFGLVKGGSTGKYKPIPTKPAYEPALGGGSRSGSSKSSRNRGKSSKNRPQPKSSATKCRKCNGVMPRNAQYCPHCYTRQ